MLAGRDDEAALVDALLERARAGTAGALVFLGEPGIGKTALLAHARERAGDMIVVAATGVESEADLRFSALFDVCRPLLDHAHELGARQRAALLGALGSGDAPADRLSIGAAVLALLAAAGPLLVIVDDAQWVDAASADALLFAARRLAAEPVAVLFAARDGFDVRGLDTVTLRGVDERAAAALLGARAGGAVPGDVAARVRAATGGSPLALVEVATLLTPAQLRGADPLPDPLPVGASVEREFSDRAARLPADVRRALLVAAVSSTPRLGPVAAALRALELEPGLLETAEDAGLIGVDGDAIAFRHPLVRSAVVHGAAPSDRRRAHRALAGAVDGDERAWHLAAAALGPDEDAAAALAEAGLRTRGHSGWASAALAFERAARLTPDPERRRERLLDAAETSWVAGGIERTLAITDELVAAGDAEAARLRCRLELHGGPVGIALDHLTETAALFDGEVAVRLLADAVDAAELVGDAPRALAAAERAVAADPAGAEAAIALGQALRLAGRPYAAPLERALAAPGEGIRALTRAAAASLWLGRADAGLAREAVAQARDQGAYGPLAHALSVAAELATAAGRWDAARAQASEGLDLARECRCAWMTVRCLEQLAWLDAAQGHEASCRERAREAIDAADRAGFRSAAGTALGLVELGRGRPAEAVPIYEAMHAPPAADLAEARERSGGAPSPAGPGPGVFGAARAQLLDGERLRRDGRRVDAREQLRAAHDTFTALGAAPWAQRAAAELRATGERLGRRAARSGEELTPQELQVALQVAEGRTNKEVGAALFLSPKTVEFHLRRVFLKLDLKSRAEVIRHFAD